MNIVKKRFIKDYIMITIGAIITALSLVILTVPNKIAAGGVSGVATIFYHMFGFKVGIVILVINVPLFLVAIYVLGGRIGIKTLWGIIVLSLTVDILTPILQPLT